MTNDALSTRGGKSRPWILHALGVMVVMVAGYVAYSVWAGPGELKATLMCATPGCAHIRAEALAVGEMLPAACPKCGQASLLPAFHCPHCRSVNIWNENRGLPPPTRCARCGREVRHDE